MKFFLSLLLIPAFLQAADYDDLYEDAVLIKENAVFLDHSRNYDRLFEEYGKIIHNDFKEQHRVASLYILPIVNEMYRISQDVSPRLKSPEMKEAFLQAAEASQLMKEGWDEVIVMLDKRELRRLISIQQKLVKADRLILEYKSSRRAAIRALKREMKFAKAPKALYKKI